MSDAFELKLTRLNRVYHPGETVEGILSIVSRKGTTYHSGIRVEISGAVAFQPGSKSLRVFETLFPTTKTISLIQKTIELRDAGQLKEGKHEIPFKFHLIDAEEQSVLYDTFHGAFVSIQYEISAEMRKGRLLRSETAACEFIVEGMPEPVLSRQLELKQSDVEFVITPDTQKHAMAGTVVAEDGFRVSGSMATRCRLSEPLRGEVTVERSSAPIACIEVKIMGVESMVGDRRVQETVEIQTTQIADGDICYGLALPVYIILPRLVTCPSVTAESFSIEFEVMIAVRFESPAADLRGIETEASKKWIASETLPLVLARG